MYWVTNAEYMDNYKLRISFNDKIQGTVDLSELIKNDHRPIIRELKDKDLFKKFKVAMDTVVWENGLDLAPEFLRENMK